VVDLTTELLSQVSVRTTEMYYCIAGCFVSI